MSQTPKFYKLSFDLIQKIDVLKFQTLALEQIKKRKLKCPELFKSNQTPKELKHIC